MGEHSPPPRPVAVAALLVGVAALLSACTSNTNATGTTTTTPPATTTTPPATTSTSSTTTTSTPSTTPCSTAVLGITANSTGGAAGTASTTFALTNTGPTKCGLNGFAKVVFYGASGAGGSGAGPALSITSVEEGGPAEPVVLAPRGQATFRVIFSQVPVNGVGCSGVASAQVTPPGSTEALEVPLSVQACGGSVTVNPITAPS